MAHWVWLTGAEECDSSEAEGRKCSRVNLVKGNCCETGGTCCPAKEFGFSLIHDGETLQTFEQEGGIIRPLAHKNHSVRNDTSWVALVVD